MHIYKIKKMFIKDIDRLYAETTKIITTTTTASATTTTPDKAVAAAAVFNLFSVVFNVLEFIYMLAFLLLLFIIVYLVVKCYQNATWRAPVPFYAGSSNNPTPPVFGSSNAQIPPVPGSLNAQMPPVFGSSNAQIPPVPGSSNAQMPPIFGSPNAQIPASFPGSSNAPAPENIFGTSTPCTSRQAGFIHSYSGKAASSPINIRRSERLKNKKKEQESRDEILKLDETMSDE